MSESPHSPLNAAASSGAQRERALSGRGDGTKKRWGVVHTPVELARSAVARVDALLQGTLGLPHGLASGEVAILDPSVGTGVWLAAALEHAAGRSSVPCGMLGLDRDGAALDLAERAVGVAAREAGWPCTLRQTNSLSLDRAFHLAPAVTVVLGNPPWASRSDSRHVEPTAAWLEDFKRDGQGAPLGERRVGVLSDDYVRFMRWAAEQARRSPRAVVCLATNHSYLDGPVHRGMRARLREWFDAIEVVDLGGNALLPRDAGRDENVFGVRPGAALTWLVRSGGGPSLAPVRLGRLRGTARDKRIALSAGTPALEALPLSNAEAPWRSAVISSDAVMAWPNEAVALDVAMPFHREGVQTNRDAFATDVSRSALLGRMRHFAEGGPGPAPRAHFDPERARARVREALAEDPAGKHWMAPLAYRPFEGRFVVTLPEVAHRPRPALARAAGRDVLCLLTSRKDRGDRAWSLWGASRGLADGCFLSTRSSCRTRVFPARNADGAPNFDAAALVHWLEGSGVALEACTPEALLELALAQLAASDYRTRFDPWLREGFPRLLPPSGAQAFDALRQAGSGVLRALLDPAFQEPPPAVAVQGVCIGHFDVPHGSAWSALDVERRSQWQRYAEALSAVDALWQSSSTLFGVRNGSPR